MKTSSCAFQLRDCSSHTPRRLVVVRLSLTFSSRSCERDNACVPISKCRVRVPAALNSERASTCTVGWRGSEQQQQQQEGFRILELYKHTHTHVYISINIKWGAMLGCRHARQLRQYGEFRPFFREMASADKRQNTLSSALSYYLLL